MRKSPSGIASCLCLAVGYIPALSQCVPASVETLWGGNENVVIQEARSIRKVRGLVQDSQHTPVSGALVEVYDHPEIVLRNPSRTRTGQSRLAACITGDSGSFSLDVPPGRYELRLSKSAEWDVTSVLLTVRNSPFSSRKGIVVRLLVGQ